MLLFFLPIGKNDKFSSSELYNIRGSFALDSNKVKNNIIIDNTFSHYVSFVVAKGNHFSIKHNTIENIITKSTTEINTETHPFYCSGTGEVIINFNILTNCFNVIVDDKKNNKILQNVLLKLKKAKSCKVSNNHFILEKSTLVKAGLIKESQSPTEIESAKFRIALIGAGTNRKEIFNSKYEFKNNEFKTPYLNDYSTIAKKIFIFQNNRIMIGYFDASNPLAWNEQSKSYPNQTLFMFRGKNNNESIVFNDNTIVIDKTKDKLFFVTTGKVTEIYKFESEYKGNSVFVKGKKVKKNDYIVL